MVRSCCICKKEVGMEEDVTFHSIPIKPDIRLKWSVAIGREVSKTAAVCSKHFHKDDIFYISMKNGTIQRRVRSGAVPTLRLQKELSRHDSTITGNENLESENMIAHENRDNIKVRQICTDEKDYKQNSSDFEHTKCEVYETENIQVESNIAIKRKSENVRQKQNKIARYVGDFCRDDFTCDRNWQLFRKYYGETSQKLKVLQERDRYRTKKIKTLRDLIVQLKNNGLISSEVATVLERNTIYRKKNQFEMEGHVKPRPNPGGPRCITAEEDNATINSIEKNVFRSAVQTVAEMHLNCSAETVKRRWEEHGYHHRISAQKEKFTECLKEQRMAFALEHFAWENEWSNTIFSDKKVFSTDESGRVILWRTKGTKYAEENVNFRQNDGRITLAFWGCMTSHGPGPLVPTIPHMNSEEYIHILSDVMMPYVAETFPDTPYVNFVQNNSGVHQARVVKDWLAAQPNLKTLDWPAKSPDLNVIENLWDIIAQEWNFDIRRTREALEEYVLAVWDGLRARPALFQNLVASMPRRLNAVIDNYGSVTRY